MTVEVPTLLKTRPRLNIGRLEVVYEHENPLVGRPLSIGRKVAKEHTFYYVLDFVLIIGKTAKYCYRCGQDLGNQICWSNGL